MYGMPLLGHELHKRIIGNGRGKPVHTEKLKPLNSQVAMELLANKRTWYVMDGHSICVQSCPLK